ncbi:hypothetical protein F4604DRAFT_1688381 [Suillus subluteus]|nr:hypothetical protein F4604DRAFT_1688381 [Suillus subluteus]
MAAAAPMSKDVHPYHNQPIPGEDVRKVSRYLTGPNPPAGYKVGVNMLWEKWTKYCKAPNYVILLLTIDMSSTLHEEPFNYLKEYLTLTITSLPYDWDMIYSQIHMNYQLQIEDQSIMPNMTITLTSVDEPTEVVLISGLGSAHCLRIRIMYLIRWSQRSMPTLRLSLQ